MVRHPLARAVRIDKMTLAALDATLRERLLGRPSPVAAMLAARPEDLRRRAGLLMVRLLERGVDCRLLEGESAVGGGSVPGQGLPAWLLGIEGPASRLAQALRLGDPPVLTRIEENLCCVDVRTVLRAEDDQLQDAIEVAVLGLKPSRGGG
jgi:L-seryl-tRNA(Ser) seleniumtransferase